MQCEAGSLRNSAALRTDLICLVRPAQREKNAKQLFFRLQALLHLCRPLLRPFITLFLSESTSHLNSSVLFFSIPPLIFPHVSSHHPSFTISPSSLKLFSAVSCHISLFSDTQDIPPFLFPPILQSFFSYLNHLLYPSLCICSSIYVPLS